MPSLTSFITGSLAPGVALTSVIFYNTSLQNRFLYIATRVRELNREAREIARAESGDAERFESLKMQVRLLTRRARLIRRAVVTVYVSLLCFILTIMGLMAVSFYDFEAWGLLPAITFVLGFIALAVAVLISTLEMTLGSASILEDVRSSFPER